MPSSLQTHHLTGHLTDRLRRFAPQVATILGGQVGYRQSGAGPITHVLLHGIGSASGSWLMQLEAAVSSAHSGLLAWDAPGYSDSNPVVPSHPHASDYSARLWAWLDALQVNQPITLVAHSLGALMATRAASEQPDRVSRLVLLAPAQGYARASTADREKKLNDRLSQLEQLGPEGLGQQRGAGMVSANASPDMVAYAQRMMSQIKGQGYTQAAHLLAHGDLLTDLAQLTCPVTVASGQLDNATPVAACQAVALAANTPWTDLGPVGHACALEASGLVNTLLNIDQSLTH